MIDFGSGIDLDRDLDLVITPAGDISNTDGLDELQKDLSYKMIETMDGRTGAALNKDTRAHYKSVATGVLRSDPRVDQVKYIEIEPAPGAHTDLTIEADVKTREGSFDFEITV